MAKKEVPIDYLAKYLPAGTEVEVGRYLQQYHIHLTIARQRQSILGDYRHRTVYQNHRISVNGNLNPYAFLITLIHEIAHLLTFEKYGNRVQAHGVEWKNIYSDLLRQFIENKQGDQPIFPEDVKVALMKSLINPAASSCADDGLIRILRKYDKNEIGFMLVEELTVNTMFKIKDGRLFKKGNKMRKRYKCEELSTGKFYLFSPVYEVELISNPQPQP